MHIRMMQVCMIQERMMHVRCIYHQLPKMGGSPDRDGAVGLRQAYSEGGIVENTTLAHIFEEIVED